MTSIPSFRAIVCIGILAFAGSANAAIPDGRALSPAGFTVPVEGFASAHALSPDGKWLAVLSQDAGALDIISVDRSVLADRVSVPAATGLTWTTDGLYVTRGYSGIVARYSYEGPKLALTKRPDLTLGEGLLNGVAEDPATHRLAVARTADRQVIVIDDRSGATLETHAASGQPFGVAFMGGTLVATLYDSDHVDAWPSGSTDAVHVPTGSHPTQLLVDGDRLFVANADGHDVVLIDPSLTVKRRFDLAVRRDAAPGQTPAGMAISNDRKELFVAESGFNDVAVVELASGRVLTRIPTAWYPMAVSYLAKAATPEKDPRSRAHLWVTSAQGLGSQPDPGGEWNGTYTGLVQDVVVSSTQFAHWTATVARNNRFSVPAAAAEPLPPIKHVVFIVRENKHFDEEFGDEAGANADPALLLYTRHFTPNAHALAEHYTLFDDFMGNGEASIYGHSWTTQGIANDYHERNAHVRPEPPLGVERVANAIWPYPFGDEKVTPADMDFDWFHDLADLPKGPRVNVSGVFGPRGQLIDELERKKVSFRVYGEQMTMLPNGRIAPGLAAHAARDYPGDHINFNELDTDRARLFLADVARNGLAAYSYVTLPTDHTTGSRAGFYTPASYVASNDFALGTIVAGLSRRPDWKNTIVFVTCDDAQGTGDHLDAHRMPAFAIGPYVRRSFVDHTHYSYPSFLRMVELVFGLDPLNIEDQLAPPMIDFFARQPSAEPFARLPQQVAMERNPGPMTSMLFEIDGPDSARIPEQEWRSIRGDLAYEHHLAYLRAIGVPRQVAGSDPDDEP